MGNQAVLDIEGQEMIQNHERIPSSAPLVLVEEEKTYAPRTTSVPHIKTSCHLIPETFVFKDSSVFSFIFDSLMECKITVIAKVSSSDSLFSEVNSKTFISNPGLNQEFCGWSLDLSSSRGESFIDNKNRELEITLECDNPLYHKETSIVSYQKSSNICKGKVTSQRLLYRSKVYELKELFGDPQQEEKLECAICLYNKRDTVIIPCYHMCLCASCGNMLRVQSYKKCPMCRCGNFYIEAQALLKISQNT